ncbi:MAG: hypothetical protein P8Z49_11845, partial [Acidobacteriota bacterium]
MSAMPSREDAWKLLCEWTLSESLRRHALGVAVLVLDHADHRHGLEAGPGTATGRPVRPAWPGARSGR